MKGVTICHQLPPNGTTASLETMNQIAVPRSLPIPAVKAIAKDPEVITRRIRSAMAMANIKAGRSRSIAMANVYLIATTHAPPRWGL